MEMLLAISELWPWIAGFTLLYSLFVSFYVERRNKKLAKILTYIGIILVILTILLFFPWFRSSGTWGEPNPRTWEFYPGTKDTVIPTIEQ